MELARAELAQTELAQMELVLTGLAQAEQQGSIVIAVRCQRPGRSGGSIMPATGSYS